MSIRGVAPVAGLSSTPHPPSPASEHKHQGRPRLGRAREACPVRLLKGMGSRDAVPRGAARRGGDPRAVRVSPAGAAARPRLPDAGAAGPATCLACTCPKQWRSGLRSRPSSINLSSSSPTRTEWTVPVPVLLSLWPPTISKIPLGGVWVTRTEAAMSSPPSVHSADRSLPIASQWSRHHNWQSSRTEDSGGPKMNPSFGLHA